MPAEIDCLDKSMRDINRDLKAFIEEGAGEIIVRNPDARHNIAVGVTKPANIIIDGSAGYYCVGLSDGPDVVINGSAGWGAAENMMSGRVEIKGNAGNSVAASTHGGTIIVHGHAAARAGIAMKGGTLIVGGDVGYMTGFMMQKGAMIICGNADEALGDSMYDGRIFVGGEIASLGNDAVVEELTDDDQAFLRDSLEGAGIKAPQAFRKVVSGKQLYNFNKKDFARWRHAL